MNLNPPKRKPRKITKRMIDKVRVLAAKGASKGAVAEHLGISRATLHRWEESNETLKQAYIEGKEADYDQVVNVLRQRALEGQYQHIAGYLRAKHQIDISDSGNAANKGLQIVVQLPFGGGNGGTVIEGQAINELSSPHSECGRDK